jgi:hypothetical protein
VDKIPGKALKIVVDHTVRRWATRDVFTLSLHGGETWADCCDFQASSVKDMNRLRAALWLLQKANSTEEQGKYDYLQNLKPQDSLLTHNHQLKYRHHVQRDIIYRMGKSIFFSSGLPICTLFPLEEDTYFKLGVAREGNYLVEEALPIFSEYGTDTGTNESTDEEYNIPEWPWDGDNGVGLPIYVESLTYIDNEGLQWPCSYAFDSIFPTTTIVHENLFGTDTEE